MYDGITDYILDYIANADTTEEVLDGIKVFALFQIAENTRALIEIANKK